LTNENTGISLPGGFCVGIKTKIREKMISKIENSKTKIEISIPKHEPESIHLAGKKTSCEICGGENFWMAKKSDAWQCWSCSPPRSESLIAQTIPPRRIAQEASREPEWPERVDSRQAQSYGPLIVLHPFSICRCGSDISEEEWNLFGARKICRGCKTEISFDEFVGVESAKSTTPKNGWRT
jgi:hypothetical protein